MDIPSRFMIHSTSHWLVNHRMDSALPGYVMLSAKIMTPSLSSLPFGALVELGVLQARIEATMNDCLKPKRVYIGRFGHGEGYPVHFHFIPIYHWVETLFWDDARYRALQDFGSLDCALPQTDGAELMLFVWREFCERPDPPHSPGASIDDTIIALRRTFDDHSCWTNP